MRHCLSAMKSLAERAAPIAVLLILWQAAVSLGLVNPDFLPSPYAISVAGLDLIRGGELWSNLGLTMLTSFGGLALATLVRSWAVALDLPGGIPKPGVPNRAALGFLPVMIVVALLVHSIAESRLLIEICYVLLVVFAIRTRGGLETRSVAAETTTA